MDQQEQDDIKFTDKQLARIKVIRELYEQQQYMYENGTHKVNMAGIPAGKDNKRRCL